MKLGDSLQLWEGLPVFSDPKCLENLGLVTPCPRLALGERKIQSLL